MKAALEAWGAGSNLFHQGVAKETDDPDMVAATLSKPGVVLKRPAGSNRRFAEHSGLPSDLGSGENEVRREKRRAKPSKGAACKISERAARKAAADFEKEQQRREAERRRQEAARESARERREKAMAEAQAVLDAAEREHEANMKAVEAERAAVEKAAQHEKERWHKQKEKLEAALRKGTRIIIHNAGSNETSFSPPSRQIVASGISLLIEVIPT
ncbi:cell envelope biogenesis protein TolA [Bradyrhizobium liaoningense]|uniref:cell envelope biogenesis protein TolA n=1 Tax=Bradyrhizobium liaoningense TaxID=43992 RepID=UPI0028A1DA5D|nr:cell envelope biogenesis protein TolA [Bradyrhizobium liaoningense]